MRDGIYTFPWRGTVIFEFVRDACVRAREFAFTTGPRDFWLASTAVWCVRRLHTPHKKRDPIPFVVGCSGELQLSASEVQTLFVSFCGGTGHLYLARDSFVRERDLHLSVPWERGTKNLRGTRLCEHGIPRSSRDHGVIPDPAQI